ncbi:ABC transporter ATP-binding protein [Paenibacillus sp. GbtcB18]|uniref:ABC transporter ATP-binding protein n=1 Tax=Paenibacillus sp. GbtcB18 TaxID=2824763 RepID=UPI0020C60585|nr:ABC transporter ATP-binding protein [Paenibacillus sp. GbtcB18]
MAETGNGTEPIVVFDGVSKSFIGKRVLKDVSFHIPRGQIIGIIGTNGSGKSTVLKLMAGLLQPSKGRVELEGQRVSRISSRRVAFLPEQDVFYPTHTVDRTLRFYTAMYRDFDIAKALELTESFGLDLKEKVARLSKGNRARLKIVLVLARQVPLIVMDEPLSGLDPLVRESIIRTVISYVDMEEQTLVLSTHEVDEIEPLLDRVILIRDGEVVRDEAVEQIQSEYGIGLVNWMKQAGG